MSLVELVRTAGPMIYPLAFCSLLASTLAIERFLALRRSRIFPREILEVAHAVRADRDLTIPIEMCKRNPGVFSDIIRTGLEQAHEPWEILRGSLEDAGRQRVPILESHLVWLQSVAQAAPLLGLLGTVLGMMKMFTSISVSGLGDPQALSAGISEAMITTAIGLAIGIPTLVAYNTLSSKSETLIGEIEAYAAQLAARLRTNEQAEESR